MEAVTYSTFRKNLRSYLDKTRDDAMQILVTSNDPDANAVVINQREWDNIQENLYIMGNSYLVDKIKEGEKQLAAGKGLIKDLYDA